MIKSKVFFVFSLFIMVNSYSFSVEDEAQRDSSFYSAASKWFSAWKLIYNDTYKMNSDRPVDFIFYDDKNVYSTSQITITKGTLVKGPDMQNAKLTWRRALHHDTLHISDGLVITAGLMCYSGEVPGEPNRYFLLMPLPSYWEMAGVSGKELGLENLITGAFIHEFTNLQQLQNLHSILKGYEASSNFGTPFGEDIIQDLFEGDSAYVKLYDRERIFFLNSTRGKNLDTLDIYEGINLMQQRYGKYFNQCYASLREIDTFFLTMRGFNQISTYLWLTHPSGGNLSEEIAMKGVRRNKHWWSQDEGFSLFLVLAKLKKPELWAEKMLTQKDGSVIQLIKNSLR